MAVAPSMNGLQKGPRIARFVESPTKKYIPSAGGMWTGIDAAAFDGEPLFTWWDIPRMIRDPRVRLCLKILRAPAAQMKWEVKAKTKEVADYVDATLKRFWRRSAGKILNRFFRWGYCPFGIEYKAKDGRVTLDRVRVIEPRDTQPLEFKEGEKKEQFAGFSWPGGTAFAPHAGWFSGDQEYDRFRDAPRIAGSFAPFLEKRSRGGIVHAGRLFYYRHAVGSDVLYYPEEDINIGTVDVPEMVSAQTYAQRMLESKANGTQIGLPSACDERGNRKWEFAVLPAQADIAGMREQRTILDAEIGEGMGIPREVLEAVKSGGSWGGRAVPASAFYGGLDDDFCGLIEAFDHAAIRPLVDLNFTEGEPYEIVPTPLAEVIMGDSASKAEGKPGEAPTVPGGPKAIPPEAKTPEGTGGAGGTGEPIHYRGQSGGRVQNPHPLPKSAIGLQPRRMSAAQLSARRKARELFADLDRAVPRMLSATLSKSEWISAKIAKIMREGVKGKKVSKEEAAAIAYSMWERGEHAELSGFDEGKHPRGQPDNAGEFVKGSGVKKPVAKPNVTTHPKTRAMVPAQVPSEKALRAIKAHVMVDKMIQRYAEEHNEPAFAKAMGGVSFPDGEAVDVVIPDASGVAAHGIELKTMVANSNNKITMKGEAMARKRKWERKNRATVHTVVLDDSAVFNAKGEGKHDLSKRRIFYRRGYGSFRVGTMHEIKGGMNELKLLLDTPKNKLPGGAL